MRRGDGARLRDVKAPLVVLRGDCAVARRATLRRIPARPRPGLKQAQACQPPTGEEMRAALQSGLVLNQGERRSRRDKSLQRIRNVVRLASWTSRQFSTQVGEPPVLKSVTSRKRPLKNFPPFIRCNPLISPVSHERIQGNPRISNSYKWRFWRRNRHEPRKSKSGFSPNP
jgi:hypothetical protein